MLIISFQCQALESMQDKGLQNDPRYSHLMFVASRAKPYQQQQQQQQPSQVPPHQASGPAGMNSGPVPNSGPNAPPGQSPSGPMPGPGPSPGAPQGSHQGKKILPCIRTQNFWRFIFSPFEKLIL